MFNKEERAGLCVSWEVGLFGRERKKCRLVGGSDRDRSGIDLLQPATCKDLPTHS